MAQNNNQKNSSSVTSPDSNDGGNRGTDKTGSNCVRRCSPSGDEDQDDELSMVDFLNEQDRLHADAEALLGASDFNNCTYSKFEGSVKRQALYACATCTPEGLAGICLACSYACHEGHDLYELYTKRYFTCDCGNEKFGGQKCKLYKEKKSPNSSNRYNQNFRGLYCSCSRPYPDPDDLVEDEMIQCIVCEDWYHERHLKATTPDSGDFSEMICPDCMSKLPFLWAYNVTHKVNLSDDSLQEDNIVDVCKTPDEKDSCHLTEPSVEDKTCQVSQEIDPLNLQTPANRKRSLDTEINFNTDNSSKKIKLETEQAYTRDPEDDDAIRCSLRSLSSANQDHAEQAAFWPRGWRSKLCRCQECLLMYMDRNIEFLIDESDTVEAYEEKGRNSSHEASDENSTMSVLAGMNRVQEIEVVRGYLDLKTELNEFLQEFARVGKVVTEADIREFFERMNQRRQNRMRIPPQNCR